MERSKLVDESDGCKESVLRLLRDPDLKLSEGEWKVLPLISDAAPWDKGGPEERAYCGSLAVPAEALIAVDKSMHTSRRACLDAPGDDDLFVDPSTGLSHGKAVRYVAFSEIRSLCASSTRLVAIYDESCSRNILGAEGKEYPEGERFVVALKRHAETELIPELCGLFPLVWIRPGISFVFASSTEVRVERVEEAIRARYGAFARLVK